MAIEFFTIILFPKTTEAEKQRDSPDDFGGCLEGGCFGLADEYIAEDCGQHGSSEDIRGPAEYKEFVTMLRSALPDLDVESQELIGEGNKVFDRHHATGAHEGQFMGMAPTCRTID